MPELVVSAAHEEDAPDSLSFRPGGEAPARTWPSGELRAPPPERAAISICPPPPTPHDSSSGRHSAAAQRLSRPDKPTERTEHKCKPHAKRTTDNNDLKQQAEVYLCTSSSAFNH